MGAHHENSAEAGSGFAEGSRPCSSDADCVQYYIYDGKDNVCTSSACNGAYCEETDHPNVSPACAAGACLILEDGAHKKCFMGDNANE